MVAHRIYGATLFLIAALLYASTYSATYPTQAFFGDVTTVFVPRIFLGAWMLFAALLCISGFVQKDLNRFPLIDWPRFIAVAVIAVATGLAMLKVGFLIATVPGFFALTWAYGYRRPFLLAILSVVLPLGIWMLFIHVFELQLPSSPWFISF